jgi:hypothetical protein
LAKDTALKALELRIAEAGRQLAIPIDEARLRRRVAALAAEFRAILKESRPSARHLLQRVLNGRRVPCVPFREGRRRGYRFCEERIPYSGLLSNDIGGPNGIWQWGVFPTVPFEGLAVAA